MCNMDQGTIPAPPVLPAGPLYPAGGHIKPPPLPPPMMGRLCSGGDKQFDPSKTTRGGSVRSRGSQTGGFRLMDNQDETGSVYSVYKQKIDSLFQSPTNQVEAVIERMFSDVALTQSSAIPRPSYPSHAFSVDYLGSVALVEKVTSLAGLQEPLRELYMAYRKRGGAREECRGKLEICGEGLRVVRAGETADDNQINPFPTIAVWSAVKFVVQGSHSRPASCAFLPLITDPDSMDKKGLFTPLTDKERRYLSSGNGSHSPMFTVVMRRKGVNRQLQCHGFVCQTSEDAIVIAATLYKSLMYHMKSKEKRLKNRNGVTCMSVASSSYNEKSGISGPSRPPRKKRSTSSSVISETDILDMVSDTQPLLSPSKKPPKKSIKSRRAPKAPPPPPPFPKPSTSKHQNDLDAILPYVEPVEISGNKQNDGRVPEKTEETEEFKEIKPKKISTLITKEQKQIAAEIKQVMSAGTGRPLRRVQSVRRGDEDEGGVRKGDNGGDILTKVTIPRSGSFLNTGGLTRYKSKICRKNGQATGGSPLGFTELFNEFRLQEGLNSFDEILGAIVDPEGMSFNDLKPIYKEFLLKLAVTLTKDELYQRSKAIMRRQRKKLMKKNNLHKSHVHMSIGNKFKRLKHVFQKSLKIKLNKKVSSQKEKSSLDPKKPKTESSISSSSYDTRHFVPIEVPSSKKPSSRRKSSRDPRNSTSEESDFFSVKRSRKNHQNFPVNQNRNSSSGYVSCSECSYDSESCTCVSADKCYCSLGNKNVPKGHGRPKTHSANCRLNPCNLNEKCYCSMENSLSFCGCDTDSCAESNKCYCQMSLKNQNAKKKHFPKDLIAGSTKHKACQKANIKTTRSLEYMQNPSERYFVKLKGKGKDAEYRRGPFFSQGHEGGKRREYGMDYELFSIVDDLEGLNDKFSRSLNESRGMDLHRSVKSYSSYRSGSKAGKTIKSTAITSGACTEALSVKKTAEIAALFSDIKLSQTTDITHLAPKNMVESLMNQQAVYDKHVYYSKAKRTGRETGNGSQRGKSGMYSAKNGLYTIQSQSDDSHNSSGGNKNGGGGKKCGREYYNDVGKIGGTLENTLGYLP